MRQRSQIEIVEVAQLIKQVVEDLESTRRPITRLNVSDIELETHPKFIQVAPQGEIVLLIAFEINETNMSGMISVCYPFQTIQSLLPLLEQGDYSRLSDVSEEELMRDNRLRLRPAPLLASSQMGTAELTVDEAGSLQVGDDGTQMVKIATDIPMEQQERYE